MNTNQPKAPRTTYDLRLLIEELHRRCKRLTRTFARFETELEDFAYFIEQILVAVSQGPNDAFDVRPGNDWASLSRDEKARMRKVAEAGVDRLEIERRDDGYADVRFGGAPPFELSPTLVRLLIALAQDGPGETNGEFVPFKTVDEVISILQADSRDATIRSVREALCRLRAALYDRGHTNPFFIQTARDKVRLKIRRGGLIVRPAGEKPDAPGAALPAKPRLAA